MAHEYWLDHAKSDQLAALASQSLSDVLLWCRGRLLLARSLNRNDRNDGNKLCVCFCMRRNALAVRIQPANRHSMRSRSRANFNIKVIFATIKVNLTIEWMKLETKQTTTTSHSATYSNHSLTHGKNLNCLHRMYPVRQHQKPYESFYSISEIMTVLDLIDDVVVVVVVVMVVCAAAQTHKSK